MSLIKTLPQAVETSLSLLEDKTMRLGTGFNFYSHLSAAYTFTLMRDSREPFHYHQQQAVDRVTKLYFEALASQEDPTAVFPYLVAGKSEVRNTPSELWTLLLTEIEYPFQRITLWTI